MQTQVRTITIQAAADGTLQGASIAYDVTLPDGSTHQAQLDVTPWANNHRPALEAFLNQASAAIAARFP